MSRYIKKSEKDGTTYSDRLKKYFGFHLNGLDIREESGQIQVQLVYCDFKHIDTVRRELAQMMPEVEFVKIRRTFTGSAIYWVLKMMVDEPELFHEPKIYVERKDGCLMPDTLMNIAERELYQRELEDDDNIPYEDCDTQEFDDDTLYTNSQD